MIVLLIAAMMVFGAAWCGMHAVCAYLVAQGTVARIDTHGVRPGRMTVLPAAWRDHIRRVLVPWLARHLPAGVRAPLQGLLLRADRGERWTVEEWMLLSGASALLGALVAGGLAPALPWGLALLGSCAGLCAPTVGLWRIAHRRMAVLGRTLPGAIDLLALAVEAGSDFTAAFARVVTRLPDGPLRAEWQRVLQAIALGQQRGEALRAMAARVQLPAMTAVATAIAQADRLGAPLRELLAAEAVHLRFERFQHAERLGAAASQKVLLPIVCCILPAFILLVLGGLLLGFATQGFGGSL